MSSSSARLVAPIMAMLSMATTSGQRTLLRNEVVDGLPFAPLEDLRVVDAQAFAVDVVAVGEVPPRIRASGVLLVPFEQREENQLVFIEDRPDDGPVGQVGAAGLIGVIGEKNVARVDPCP